MMIDKLVVCAAERGTGKQVKVSFLVTNWDEEGEIFDEYCEFIEDLEGKLRVCLDMCGNGPTEMIDIADIGDHNFIEVAKLVATTVRDQYAPGAELIVEEY